MPTSRGRPMVAAALGVCAACLGGAVGVAVAEGSLWWLSLFAVVATLAVLVHRAGTVPPSGAVALLVGTELGSAALVGGLLSDQSRSGAANSVLVAAVAAGLVLVLAARQAARRRAVVELERGWVLARALEEQQDSAVVAALVQERALMAAEVHDQVGHRLSLAAVRLGRLWQEADLSQEQRAEILSVRDDLAGITDDVGATVAVLEGGHPLPVTTRDPGAVVAAARAAGQVVTADLAAVDGVDAIVRDTVGRVLGEAVANAARHAPGAPVDVRTSRHGDTLLVTVTNPVVVAVDGSPREAHGTVRPGTGLRRLQDRAALLGGSLAHAGGDRFTVEAHLPARAVLHAPEGPTAGR